MKYLAILILSMTLFACSGAKKQTGYSDSKCFNLCKAPQECAMSEDNKRFYCRAIPPNPYADSWGCNPPCASNQICELDMQTGKHSCGLKQ